MIEDRLWEKAAETLFISKEQFLRNLEGWDIEQVEIEGELAGVVLSKGAEIHFQSFGTGHPITGKMLWERLNKVIDQHGYAMTRTPKDDARQNRFNLRFGFKVVGEDEYDFLYRIDRLRHA